MADTNITVGTNVITFRDRRPPLPAPRPTPLNPQETHVAAQNYYFHQEGISSGGGTATAPSSFQSITLPIQGVLEEGDDTYTPGIDQILIDGQALDLHNPTHRRAFEYFATALGVRARNIPIMHGSQLYLFNNSFAGAYLPALKLSFDTAEAARDAVERGSLEEARAFMAEQNERVGRLPEFCDENDRTGNPRRINNPGCAARYHALTPETILELELLHAGRDAASSLAFSLDRFYNSSSFTTYVFPVLNWLFTRPQSFVNTRRVIIDGQERDEVVYRFDSFLRVDFYDFFSAGEAWDGFIARAGALNLESSLRRSLAIFMGAPEAPLDQPSQPAPTRVARNDRGSRNNDPYRSRITVAEEGAVLTPPPVSVEVRPSAAAAPRRPHHVPRNRHITVNMNM